MKRKNIIIVSIIMIIVLGVAAFFIFKNPENNNNTSSENNNFSLNGKYIVTYTNQTPDDIKANAPSEITLNQDKTFTFKYNNCDAFYTTTGTYQIIDNKLILNDLSSPINRLDTISFNIISNNEFYLNDFIGCIINSNDYNKQYGNFKKID